MAGHKASIHPGFITKYTLKLTELNSSNFEGVVAEFDELPGIDRVRVNGKRNAINIAYDASQHNIDEMIRIVEKHGFSIKDSWWVRVRLNWQRILDQNIKDNSNHEAHCCNKSPRP